MTAARHLTDADVEAIAEAVASKLAEKRAKPEAAPVLSKEKREAATFGSGGRRDPESLRGPDDHGAHAGPTCRAAAQKESE